MPVWKNIQGKSLYEQWEIPQRTVFLGVGWLSYKTILFLFFFLIYINHINNYWIRRQIEFSQHQCNLIFWGEFCMVLNGDIRKMWKEGCIKEMAATKRVYGSGSANNWADLIMACNCQKKVDLFLLLMTFWCSPPIPGLELIRDFELFGFAKIVKIAGLSFAALVSWSIWMYTK